MITAGLTFHTNLVINTQCWSSLQALKKESKDLFASADTSAWTQQKCESRSIKRDL
ncbi:hypothetical protein Vi05172_g495 [Venturia inaequalis]|nr:hypothetical protein Vi05172_g495 [Venturia inaequalis]